MNQTLTFSLNVYAARCCREIYVSSSTLLLFLTSKSAQDDLCCYRFDVDSGSVL